MLIEIEEEGIPEDEMLYWVPVWDWLKGIFGFQASFRARKQIIDCALLSSGEKPLPLLWFECLMYAERLRTEFRDGRELLCVQRKMKELNPVMFTRYMDKISG